MGYVATPEALALRWAEVMSDPTLRNLPYKIELNERGKIEMSPASNMHALLQGHVGGELKQQLRNGRVLTECSIATSIGIRVPDVAWASKEFLAVHGVVTPFPRAPEICVEIISPSNTDAEIQEKTAAYLAAGAKEVWLVSESGISYQNANGKHTQSMFNVTVSLDGLP